MGLDDEKKAYCLAVSGRMREALGKKGIILKYLYDKLGVSHTTMTSYLQGKSLPDLFVLKRFAEICETSLAYIVCGDSEAKNAEENHKLYSEIDQQKGQISLLKEMLTEYKMPKKKSRHHAYNPDI